MPISFANIPANIKVPLYYVEVDPSMAGLPSINLRCLLVGIMNAQNQIATSAVTEEAGSGYAVADTIDLPGGVVLTVATLSGTNGVGTVTVTTPGSVLDPPTNPVAQLSTSGAGTGAAFNVNWTPDPTESGVFGSQYPNIPVPVGSQSMADAFFGPGTELSRMFQAYYSNNFANEVWGCGVTGGVGAVAATGTITIVTPPTQAGTLHLYVAGTHVPVNLMTTDTVDDIAAAIADAINTYQDPTYSAPQTSLPISATTTTGGIVNLTAAWQGESGNEINLMLNFYGTLGSEITPPGLTILLPPTGFLTGGVGVPDFSEAISNLGDEPYEYVAMGYTDSDTLFAWDQEYGFTDTGRWGWERQLYGHCFFARRDTYSNLIIWGSSSTMNSAVESVMAVDMASPSATFEWAAAYAAMAQRALINDPARPLQSLTLNNIRMAPKHQRFNWPELNALASNGLAIQQAGSDGQPMILREQTTYQLNLWGQTDDAYELVTTLATLAKLFRNQKQAITSKFPRSKLADDGTKFGPGQAIVTPGIIKAELVNEYQIDMWNGLVENLTAFKANLLVERDPNDPNRLNVLYPPDLINQLRIFAVLAQFRLQYDRGIDLAIIGQAPAPYQASSGAPQ